MAIYSVTYSEDDDWGETPKDRYKTRWEADARLAEAESRGLFARLVKWEGGEAKEMARTSAVVPTEAELPTPTLPVVTTPVAVQAVTPQAPARLDALPSQLNPSTVPSERERLHTTKLVLEIAVAAVAVLTGIVALFRSLR